MQAAVRASAAGVAGSRSPAGARLGGRAGVRAGGCGAAGAGGCSWCRAGVPVGVVALGGVRGGAASAVVWPVSVAGVPVSVPGVIVSVGVVPPVLVPVPVPVGVVAGSVAAGGVPGVGGGVRLGAAGAAALRSCRVVPVGCGVAGARVGAGAGGGRVGSVARRRVCPRRLGVWRGRSPGCLGRCRWCRAGGCGAAGAAWCPVRWGRCRAPVGRRVSTGRWRAAGCLRRRGGVAGSVARGARVGAGGARCRCRWCAVSRRACGAVVVSVSVRAAGCRAGSVRGRRGACVGWGCGGVGRGGARVGAGGARVGRCGAAGARVVPVLAGGVSGPIAGGGVSRRAGRGRRGACVGEGRGGVGRGGARVGAGGARVGRCGAAGARVCARVGGGRVGTDSGRRGVDGAGRGAGRSVRTSRGRLVRCASDVVGGGVAVVGGRALADRERFVDGGLARGPRIAASCSDAGVCGCLLGRRILGRRSGVLLRSRADL